MELEYVGHRGRLPRKSDVAAWSNFRAELNERKNTINRDRLESLRNSISLLEKEIAKLSQLDEKSSQKTKLARCHDELKSLKTRASHRYSDADFALGGML